MVCPDTCQRVELASVPSGRKSFSVMVLSTSPAAMTISVKSFNARMASAGSCAIMFTVSRPVTPITVLVAMKMALVVSVSGEIAKTVLSLFTRTNTPVSTVYLQVAAGGFHSLALTEIVLQTYCTAGFSASGCAAMMSSSGLASATASTGFILMASTVEGAKDGLFFYGTNGRQANPWGTGGSFVCVIPPRLRGAFQFGVGTAGGCDGVFAEDLNARWCSTCPKPLHNPGAGAVVQAQLWYRDPQNTGSQTTSMSDAIEFLVVP